MIAAHPETTTPWRILDDRQRGTRFLQLPVTSVLNSPATTGMDFWSVNPYVGCEFGCRYCYARFAHQYVVERAQQRGALAPDQVAEYRGGEGWEAFERRIFVKAGAAEVLALTLRPARLGGRAIVIGTATDPYQPAERTFRITRALLERMTQVHGLHVGLITKSPLVTRDIDVLRRLGERSRVTLHISMIGVDAPLVRRLEPRSPVPAVRLRALEQLVGAGLHAGVMLAPVLPGITDDVPQLEALLRAARDAGAHFVRAEPLRLYPGIRRRFFPAVAEHWPHLVAKYEGAFDTRGIVRRDYAAALQRRLARLRQKWGVPSGREEGAHAQPFRCPAASVQEELTL
jgi:DNA repair photolyase